MIKNYLKDRRVLLYIVAVACISYCSVLYFEKVAIDVIYYSSLIFFMMSFLLGMIDFYHYQKQIQRIKWLAQHLNTEKFDFQCNDYMLRCLVDIIVSLQTQQDEYSEEYEMQKREMIDFYALWIHQVKTPIFALKLLSTKSAVLSEITKIEHYIEMVLNYIKLQDGSEDLVLDRVQVHQLVHQVVKSFSRVFIVKKLNINLHLDEVELVSDEKWLKFALSQILSNALKYTNDGEICITLTQDSLSIQDTGIGMQPQDIPRIFEKGFSGGRILEKENASGIGLYLCKKSLDLLGHEIEVKSQLGEGSSFEIIFHQIDTIYE